MSYVKYGVPSHEPAGLQAGSRISQVLSSWPGVAIAVAIQGFSNQGLVNHQVPVETVETPPSRVVKVASTSAAVPGVVDLGLTVQIDSAGTARPLARTITGREAHFAEARLLDSRVFIPRSLATGSVTLGITADIAVAGSGAAQAKVIRAKEPQDFPGLVEASRSYSGLVNFLPGAADLGLTLSISVSGTASGAAVVPKTYRAKDPEGFPLLEPGSRAYFPKSYRAGASDLPIVLGIDTAGTASGPPAQIPKVYRAKVPAGWVDVDPVSRPYIALDGRIAGSADLPITLSISTSGTVGGAVVTRLGIAIPGQGNVGLRTKGVEQESPPSVEFGSRGFIYYNSAPPIYRVIIPGGTNQGFQFVGIPRDPVVVPASKLFKGYASGIIQRSADLGLTLAIDTVGTARPRAVIHRAKEPHNRLQRELESRLFHRPRITYTGSVTLPVTVGISAAGIAKTYGAATLGLILNMAATVPVGWTLVVMEEDNSLTLQILPVESTQNLSVSLEDNTLTLTVMEEQDS